MLGGMPDGASFFDPPDRLDFERRRLPVRLGLLLGAVPLWFQIGPRALPATVVIGATCLGSFALIALLLRFRRAAVLRLQLALRVLDVFLVFVTLHNVHRIIPPGDSFDGFYVLTVIAATATHGRAGMVLMAGASTAAMLSDRWLLGLSGIRPFDAAQVAGAFAWALLFAVTALLVHQMMRTSSEVTRRRQEAFNAELRSRNVALQEATAKLLAVNKELESFSYSVSHDLRAPLRGMQGFSELLLKDYGPRLDDRARDYLNRIRAAGLRMGQLIDDLLRLSRISTAALEREQVDLTELARQVGGELRQQDPERDVTFAIAEGLCARGDRRLLEVVLENLLGNAWKFTGSHPSARIEVGRAACDGQPAFYVRDDGAGFDMAYAANLFGPFQRLHRSDEFEGSGIGLATVQRIIRRHGGEVWAESAPECGATFYFTLPEVEAEV